MSMSAQASGREAEESGTKGPIEKNSKKYRFRRYLQVPTVKVRTECYPFARQLQKVLLLEVQARVNFHFLEKTDPVSSFPIRRYTCFKRLT